MSLRRSILLWIAGLTTIVGLVGVVTTYQLALEEAGEFMDDQMRQYGAMVGATGLKALDPSPLQEPEDRLAALIWDEGRLLDASADAPRLTTAPDKQGFGTVQSDEAWRTFVLKIGTRRIMIAQRMSARGEVARHAALNEALPIVALIPLTWLVVTLSAARIMKRLSALADSIAARADRTSAPIPLDCIPREIRPFIVEIDRLLARQQSALDQQRRFIADSAHEMRTPLTALQIQIDNLASIRGSDDGAALDALRDGSRRVAAMLNQLLRLAIFDAHASAEVSEDVNLADVLRSCIADLVEFAGASEIDLGLTTCQPTIVRSVRADLVILVTNLIDNAIRYTPRHGRVDCTLERCGSSARLTVSDTGPGVAEADMPRLTERFFRGANAADGGSGSGLGLAIAKAIADRHQIVLSFANEPVGTGLCASLIFSVAR